MTTGPLAELESRASLPPPIHRWATDGITALPRPGISSRLLMRLVAGAEALNRIQSRLGNPPIYNNADFAWTTGLVRAFPQIRAELDAIMTRRAELPPIHSISPDAASITSDAGWKVFILMAYGITSPPGIKLCPETWHAVSAIPGLRTAMFSVLEAGKRLPPHRGPYNGVLRMHLGLDVPGDSAAITIAGETRHWRNGEVLIFDDAFEHCAWNDSDRPRTVLFVDFARPLHFPAGLLNRWLLDLAPRSAMLRDAKKRLRAWEGSFHV